ncbi:MAG: methyl-accepting chemotaxis protein [Candidatus Galacturonibacter soehngenii]|nr:methyl-accepting chemotaxis protein [Candidatus Galacturonibacter soehngenii]
MFKSIKFKLLGFVIPVILISFTCLSIYSIQTSKDIVRKQIQSTMESELGGQIAIIKKELEEISQISESIADAIAATYQNSSLTEYESFLSNLIYNNDMILGSGIWFEPYIYDQSQKYIGPYIFKEGGKAKITYDYSNSEYDYFQYDWYTQSITTKETKITEPYFDEVSNLTMSSCSTPIITSDGTVIGIITVDIELTAIQEIVNNIKIGEGGTAFLLNSEGVYLASNDETKIMTVNMKDEENPYLAKIGNELLSKKSGNGEYSIDKEKYTLFYDTLEGYNWKLGITIPQKELFSSVNRMSTSLTIISTLSILICIVIISLVISSIVSGIIKINKSITLLAAGDFSKEPVKITSKDELGKMSKALAIMYENNKNIIKNITSSTTVMNESSMQLNKAVGELSSQFDQINSIMQNVNGDMMSTSAATEELNASVEEVDASVNVLAVETESSAEMAVEIENKAIEIQNSSRNSFEQAEKLVDVYEEKLSASIENANVVANIATLANVISSIAEQINLLSLNATIEAARAGEQGKGFAVVAGEIGKLATETTKAVEEIKNTIDQVTNAFNGLTINMKEILVFLTQTVTPDYNNFVGVAEQYGEDAKKFKALSQKVSEMSSNIELTVTEITSAIQNITESAQNTAQNGAEVSQAIQLVSDVVGNVADRSVEQENTAIELDEMVRQFKL